MPQLASSQAISVPRYEYLIHTFVSNDAANEMKAVSRALTTLGKNAWELVAVVPIQNYRAGRSLGVAVGVGGN
jgi:hypothetical protein